MCGFIEAVKYLFDKGADFNICMKHNQCRLPVGNTYISIVKLLIDYEVDVSFVFDRQNQNRICDKIHNTSDIEVASIIEMLINRGYKPDITTFGTLVRFGYYQCVKLLVEWGIDVNSNDSKPLLTAIKSHNLKMIELLIKNGARVDWSYVEVNTSHDRKIQHDFLKSCGFSAEELLKINETDIAYNF